MPSQCLTEAGPAPALWGWRELFCEASCGSIRCRHLKPYQPQGHWPLPLVLQTEGLNLMAEEAGRLRGSQNQCECPLSHSPLSPKPTSSLNRSQTVSAGSPRSERAAWAYLLSPGEPLGIRLQGERQGGVGPLLGEKSKNRLISQLSPGQLWLSSAFQHYQSLPLL